MTDEPRVTGDLVADTIRALLAPPKELQIAVLAMNGMQCCLMANGAKWVFYAPDGYSYNGDDPNGAVMAWWRSTQR